MFVLFMFPIVYVLVKQNSKERKQAKALKKIAAENQLELDVINIYGSLALGLDTRNKRLIRIEEAEIVGADFDNPMARITVRFAADIAALTKDKDGNMIAGSLDDAIQSRDVWTFSRKVTAMRPDWLLDETDEG